MSAGSQVVAKKEAQNGNYNLPRRQDAGSEGGKEDSAPILVVSIFFTDNLSKVRQETESVRTNNPYMDYLSHCVLSQHFPHRKDSRIFPNSKIEFQAGAMNDH